MILKIIILIVLGLPINVYSANVKVHEHIFKNGLKVLVKTDHRSPVVVTQIWYKVGSSYETGGITGISHMLEHMMFKGTEKYPAGEFSRIIAENGGRENAFTGRDYTAYFQTMEKSHLEISFKLEADRMQNIRLNVGELKKELKVVNEERYMRVEDRPRSKLQEHFMAMAFSNSPYKNPIIGWQSDIENYQIDDLQNWYDLWYLPNNATLVVVGDVEPEKVFSLAKKYFANIKPGKIKPVKPQTETKQLGVRKIIIKLPAKLPYLVMAYKVPVLNSTENQTDVYALEVLTGILAGDSSSRLETQLVRGKQIAVSAEANYNLISRLPWLFSLEATPAKDYDLLDIEQELKAQILKLKNELVLDSELQRVKTQILANSIYEQDSNFYQAMQLGIFETVGIGWQKVDEYTRKIKQITAKQVQHVARKYLLDEYLNIAYLEPQPKAKKNQTQGKSSAQ